MIPVYACVYNSNYHERIAYGCVPGEVSPYFFRAPLHTPVGIVWYKVYLEPNIRLNIFKCCSSTSFIGKGRFRGWWQTYNNCLDFFLEIDLIDNLTTILCDQSHHI